MCNKPILDYFLKIGIFHKILSVYIKLIMNFLHWDFNNKLQSAVISNLYTYQIITYTYEHSSYLGF